MRPDFKYSHIVIVTQFKSDHKIYKFQVLGLRICVEASICHCIEFFNCIDWSSVFQVLAFW